MFKLHVSILSLQIGFNVKLKDPKYKTLVPEVETSHDPVISPAFLYNHQ